MHKKKKMRKFEKVPFFGSVLGGFSRSARTNKGDTINEDSQLIECLATYFCFPSGHKEELNGSEEEFLYNEDTILLEVAKLIRISKDKDKLVEIFLLIIIFTSSEIVVIFCNRCLKLFFNNHIHENTETVNFEMTSINPRLSESIPVEIYPQLQQAFNFYNVGNLVEYVEKFRDVVLELFTIGQENQVSNKGKG